MMKFIDRFLAFALIVVVIVLTVTAIPSLAGEPLRGRTLMGHMAASGAMVFLLPAYAISGLVRLTHDATSSKLRVIGFWGLIVTGLVTIATVFICMLPIPSTNQMHTLILLHGLAGYATAVAAIVMVAGLVQRKSV